MSSPNAYPADIQSLAGGIFNEVTRFGNAVGLAVTAAIAASVTGHSKAESTNALSQGYRAATWTIFAAAALVIVVTFVGLAQEGRACWEERRVGNYTEIF